MEPNTNKTFLVSRITPALVVGVAAQLLEEQGKNAELTPRTEEHHIFLEQRPAILETIAATISPDELGQRAQIGGVDEVNRFLRERGFDIQLNAPSAAADTIAAAATLNAKLGWKYPGRPGQPIRRHATSGDAGQLFHTAHLPEARIVRVEGNRWGSFIPVNGRGERLTVFLAPVHQTDTWSAELSEGLVRKAVFQHETRQYDSEELVFPRVKADVRGKLDWLLGLLVGGYSIDQALQQIGLEMDHMGAHAREAAAVVASRGMSPPPRVIDGPMAFGLVCTPPGNRATVLMHGVLGEDTWVPV